MWTRRQKRLNNQFQEVLLAFTGTSLPFVPVQIVDMKFSVLKDQNMGNGTPISFFQKEAGDIRLRVV